jgi:hypothetical protein
MVGMRDSARWRVEVEEAAQLWPASQSIGLVVYDDLGSRMLGWPVGSRVLREMPTVQGMFRQGRPVLCPGGHGVLLDLRTRVVDEAGGVDRVERGVARVDLRTGAVARLSFDTLPNSKMSASVAGSPDGARVAFAWAWQDSVDAAVSKHAYRTGLYLATLDGSPPLELTSLLNAGCSGLNVDDVPVQWSPDGALVAFAILRGGAVGPFYETLIYDAATGTEIQRVPGTLCGSASWAPDSRSLLVDHHEDDTWIHDVQIGTAHPVTVLAPRGSRDWRPFSPLGLAEEDRLVTARRRGERMTISLMDLSDGTTSEILSYSYGGARYPTIAAMPSGTWTPLGGTAP